jgi:glycosyltransferase involved in cell wall biosynthesis
MPAYNAGKFIPASVASVMAQTYFSWELVIIDDGSTDDTAKVIDHLKLPKSQLKVITTSGNAGPGAARNHGINQAKGNLIAFLDADDHWEPTKLELQVTRIQEGYDLVFSSGYFIGADPAARFATAKGPYSGTEMFEVLYQHNRIPIVSVLARRSILTKAGLFKEEGLLSRKCEDYDLWMRVAQAGGKFYGMPEKLVGYRVHPDSSTHQPLVMLRGDLAAVEQFKDAVPAAARAKRLRDIYNRLAAAAAAHGESAAAHAYLRTLRRYEPYLAVAAKTAALRLSGRRYNGIYYRLLSRLP